MEHFFNVIKIFIEKHLIPTIVSVVLTVVSILLFPSLSLIQNKTGQALFWLFIFCCWFLVIHFLKWFVGKIRVGSSRLERYERNATETSKAVHELYDRLSPEDKGILLNFIILKNKPLKVRDVDTHSGLLNEKREMFNITRASSELTAPNDEFWLLPILMALTSMNKSITGCEFYLYRMKDSAYELFKQIYDHNGKLGNF